MPHVGSVGAIIDSIEEILVLVMFMCGLGCRRCRRKPGGGRRKVFGRVQRRGHGGRIVDIRKGTVSSEGRSSRRESEALVKWAG